MATLSRDGFLRLLPALQNHPRVTFGKATRATISSAALRPELLVESRGDDGISVKANFPAKGRKIDHEHEHEHEHEKRRKALILWNATEAWMLRNNEFVRCGEALPAGSTHLIERPLLLEGDRALHFLAFDLPRLRDAFDVRAGEGVRLPEIAHGVASPRAVAGRHAQQRHRRAVVRLRRSRAAQSLGQRTGSIRLPRSTKLPIDC